MAFFQKILHKLNGMHYTQEYLCLPKEQHTHPLYAYLVFENISPLKMESTVTKKYIVAILSLKKIKEQKTDNSFVYYFEGINGKHKFLSPFHQFIVQLNNQLYNKKIGNVFLEYNLYKQVQIAYAIPRVISLITVSSDNLFNLFTTDLHGQINEDYYIISLRYQGNACKQVEQAKKIVLSNVDASYYKEAYNLGKNHMQPLKEKSNFVFSEEHSYTLKLPLPPNVIECRELELKDSFIHGIHKLLLFKILNHQRSQNSSTTLAHVHNAYATWRYKQGLGNYFFLCK